MKHKKPRIKIISFNTDEDEPVHLIDRTGNYKFCIYDLDYGFESARNDGPIEVWTDGHERYRANELADEIIIDSNGIIGRDYWGLLKK